MSVVLVPGREWEEGDPMPNPLALYIAMLTSCGFNVKIGYAESFEEGGEYGESAQKAGDKKPDKHIKLVWVDAMRDKYMATITYQYTNDNPTPTCVQRTWCKRIEQVSDREMKQRIKDANTLD